MSIPVRLNKTKQKVVKILKEFVILEKLKDEFDVEPAKREDVEVFVKRHYLKTFPAGIKRIYAIYQKQTEGRHMVGMIIYGTPFMTAPKFLEPEVSSKEVLELKRLYIDDIGIKNLESYVIGQSLNLLKRDDPNIKVVLTFADDLQGHVGGIYQATNAIYLGKSDTGKHKYAYIVGGNNMKAIKAKLDSLKQNYPKKPLAEALTPESQFAYRHYGNFVLNALMGRNPDEYYAQHQKDIDAVASTLQIRLGPRTGAPIYRGIILDPSEVQNGVLKGVPEIKYVSFTENKEIAIAFADTENPMSEFMKFKYPNKVGYLITKNTYDPKQLLYHHSWSRLLPMQQAFGDDVKILEKQKEVMLKPEAEYHVEPVPAGASNNYWVGESIEEGISRADFAKSLDKIRQQSKGPELSQVQIAMKSRIRNRIEYARLRKDHIARGKCIHDENDAYQYPNKVKSLLCKDCIETRYEPKRSKALFNRKCPHCLTYNLYYLSRDNRMSTLCRSCDKRRVGKKL